MPIKPTIRKQYKKIEFFLHENGHWIINSSLPVQSKEWTYWNRFFTDEEVRELDKDKSSRFVIARHIRILKRAIKRAYKNEPYFTGPIHER